MRRGLRPPTLATSIVSSSSTIDDSAHPYSFDLLGIGNRRPQTDGDVAREVIAADSDDSRVPEMPTFVDGEVHGAASDIDEGDAQPHLA